MNALPPQAVVDLNLFAQRLAREGVEPDAAERAIGQWLSGRRDFDAPDAWAAARALFSTAYAAAWAAKQGRAA